MIAAHGGQPRASRNGQLLDETAPGLAGAAALAEHLAASWAPAPPGAPPWRAALPDWPDRFLRPLLEVREGLVLQRPDAWRRRELEVLVRNNPQLEFVSLANVISRWWEARLRQRLAGKDTSTNYRQLVYSLAIPDHLAGRSDARTRWVGAGPPASVPRRYPRAARAAPVLPARAPRLRRGIALALTAARPRPGARRGSERPARRGACEVRRRRVAPARRVWQRRGVDAELEIVTIASHDDEGLLDEFHAGVYWEAFPEQQEPVAVWKRALWGGAAPYELAIRIAGRALRDRARREILGGIAFERYPRSGCGLITYMAIAPPARRHGLGKRLQRESALALFGAGVRAVFGEVNDPRLAGAGVDEPVEDMWRRLERNQAWGARVVNARYVQPALAPGLERDHGLCLIALAGEQPLPATMPGRIVRDFVEELYAATEGGAPDRELLAGIPEDVELIELRR